MHVVGLDGVVSDPEIIPIASAERAEHCLRDVLAAQRAQRSAQRDVHRVRGAVHRSRTMRRAPLIAWRALSARSETRATTTFTGQPQQQLLHSRDPPALLNRAEFRIRKMMNEEIRA
jgi:hypothetical protein